MCVHVRASVFKFECECVHVCVSVFKCVSECVRVCSNLSVSVCKKEGERDKDQDYAEIKKNLMSLGL